MSNFLKNFSIFKSSLLVGLLFYIFITFFTSSIYKSESIIDVSLNKTESLSTNIVSSILPTSGNQDAFQVKLYLESREASFLVRERINIATLFQDKNIKIFSRFRESKRHTFHEYLQDKIKITVDGDSNSIILQTFSFDPADSKNINLHLIDMTADFFNKKTKLASLNARSNKICELYSANAGILDIGNISMPVDTSIVENSSSANDLLITKAENFKDFCLEKLQFDKTEDIPELLNIPIYELKNINAEASKRIIMDLYQKSMDAVSDTDYMEVIAEPIISDQPESKRAILYSFLVTIFSFIVLLGIRIIFSISDEFKT
jgi:capsule polysaccharide export protein KpsE/RkpR